MKTHNKKIGTKGQMGQLVVLILIIAGAIVIYAFIAKFVGKSTYEEAINTCRFSVIAQSATELGPSGSGWKSPLDINCEKRYISFYNTKVMMGLSPTNMKLLPISMNGQRMTKFRSLTEYAVYQVIAEEMRICKFEFADGKVEIFTNDEKTFDTQNVCFVCSEINFEDTVNQRVLEDFREFTEKTRISNDDKTYFEYLTEDTVMGNPMWSQPSFKPTYPYGNLSIDTSKSYVVVVRKYSSSNLDFLYKGILLDSLIDKIMPLLKGGPLTVSIIPASDVNKYCDLQAS
ncbi:MAG: hypothetical protein ACP5OA_06575 [Candidatus Woesearchaeota archaeon]